MQWLAAICVRRPVFASVIILVLTVIGGFSYFELGVDRFPKIEFPVVVVGSLGSRHGRSYIRTGASCAPATIARSTPGR